MLVSRRLLSNLLFFCFVLNVALHTGASLAAPARTDANEERKDLVLDNDYVRIVQNTHSDGQGRFTLVAKANEQHEELLYGSSSPWTSYTTIRIDGKDFVFGGPTNRRAGGSGEYGIVEWTGLDDKGNLVTAVNFDNSILVLQRLSLTLGFTTGLQSSMAVEYEIVNIGNTSKEVGLRVMLDTKLGKNDGAPIRFGHRVITTDTLLTASETPVFWQAFDDLGETAVIAESVLQGPGLTPPDKMVITNWGSLADHLWDVPLISGRDFSREGEWYDLDSAVALYWEPVRLDPGEARTYTTQYGVGELSGARGELTIGLASPAKVRKEDSFPVIAYIEGTLGRSSDVMATLSVPNGWEIVRGEAQIQLGDISYSDVKQVEWIVRASGDTKIGDVHLVVTTANGNPIQTTRVIEVEFHDMEIRFNDVLDVPHQKGKLSPFLLQATVTNAGNASAPPSIVALELLGASLSEFDAPTRIIPFLKPGDSVTLSWAVIPEDGSGVVTATVRIHGEQDVEESARITVPSFSPTIELLQANMIQHGWNKILLYAYEMPSFHEILVDVSYWGDLDVVHVAKGELMVVNDNVVGELSYRHVRTRRHVQIVVRGDGLIKGTGPVLSITTVGEGHISIDRFQMYTAQGQIGNISIPKRYVMVR